MKKFLMILFVVVALVCIAPFLFMYCFNLVAPLFWSAAPSLTFIQSLALLIGVRLLLGRNPLGVGDIDKDK